MYRPKNSNNPAHLVPGPAETMGQYLAQLSLRATYLLAEEPDPDQAAAEVGQQMYDRGELQRQPTNKRELVASLESDDNLLNSLSLMGAEPPLVKASKEEEREALEMDLQSWTESLLAGSLE